MQKHDLGVVAKVADYVAVMYAGKIVEKGTVNEIFYDPRHPYTWGLLSAMPDLDTNDDKLYTIPGTPPNLTDRGGGDAFAPRNIYALNIDSRLEPPMFKISDTHYAATWLLHEHQEVSINSKQAPWNTNDKDGNFGYKVPFQNGYHIGLPYDRNNDLRSEMTLRLQQMGVEVKYHHHDSEI